MSSAANDNWSAGDAYEAYMGRWSRPIARAFVDWLRPPVSGDWLELGCGTGALTSAICERCSPASVTACDASQSFVDHARRLLSDTRASFVVAAADALPRRDAGFDLVVSGLVLNFLPEPDAVMKSVRERLRRAGTAAACVWDYADGMEPLAIFWDEAIALDPEAAALDERRRFPLCSEAALRSLFERAGLAQVRVQALQADTEFTCFDDYWTPFLRGTGPAPAYVATLDPGRRDALRERLRRRLPADAGGRIRLAARAFAVCGTRP